MNRSRHLATVLLLLGLLTLAAPALALAGGSAGDQQYTDPLTGTHTQTHPSSSGTPTASTPTASTPTPGTTSGATTSAAVPTATTASAPNSTTTTSKQAVRQLPRTGYDSWLAGSLGGLLMIGGLGLRRRTRRA